MGLVYFTIGRPHPNPSPKERGFDVERKIKYRVLAPSPLEGLGRGELLHYMPIKIKIFGRINLYIHKAADGGVIN